MVAKELRGHTVAKPSLAIDRPVWRSPLYYMMVAAFFNQMLPSTVGGDAARVYLFARDGVNLRIASRCASNLGCIEVRSGLCFGYER